MFKYYCVLCLLLANVFFSSAALAAKVDSLRLWRAPDHTRLVFDLDAPIKHNIFTLKNPDRIVVDMSATSFDANPDNVDFAKTPLESVRSGKRENGDIRVVLDVKHPVNPRSFNLSPNVKYGHRLVIDLYDVVATPEPQASIQTISESKRDIIIAIDAGHGGEDPGAIGPRRLLEKKVVMQIAQQLKRKIDSTRGYKGVLVRTGDYYLPLRKRSQKARDTRADLFISIHADAFHLPAAHGASVYALSERGATSETAKYLAQRQNRSDLIGGVGDLSLKDKDTALAQVLLDLSMNATLETSLKVGSEVLQEMGNITRLHKKKVEQAGFAVLKSPDMPSLLIETGFISNPAEAKKLASSAFQKKIANAITKGIRRYYENYPPDGTYIAGLKRGKRGVASGEEQEYIIKNGDTLSEIAEKFEVSIKHLRQANNIKGSQIRIGQTIRIPATR